MKRGEAERERGIFLKTVASSMAHELKITNEIAGFEIKLLPLMSI